MIGRARRWLRHDLWFVDLGEVPRLRALMIGALRVALHAARSFRENLVDIQAAGMTMMTLLALVPLLWLAFAVAQAMGIDRELSTRLEEWRATSELPPALLDALVRLQVMANSVSIETLGIFGSLILAYSGYALFTRVEASFNHVWGGAVRRRHWSRRLGGFVALIALVPLLLVSATVLAALLHQGSIVTWAREHLPWLALLYDFGLRFVPPIFVWCALTALYKLMPSAAVRWRAAALAGAAATLALWGLHVSYVSFQVGVAHHNAVYAALAAIPLLLIFLQLVWIILLAGARVGFAVQNIHALVLPQEVPAPSQTQRQRLAIAVMSAVCRTQEEDAPPLDPMQFAYASHVPGKWVDEVLTMLLEAGLVEQAIEPELGYRPGRPPVDITLLDVARAVGGGGAEGETVVVPEHLERHLEAVERRMTAILERTTLLPAEE